MKQLKFMLAAATAISLATAAQAAGPFSGSTDFEGNFDLATGFTFDGQAGDNESAIIPEVPVGVERPANHGFTADRANVLQVNTGTDPIVRSIGTSGTQTAADVLNANGSIYIDTLVQFTVTPAGDTVTATDGDKLMIYLAEFTNEVDGVLTYTTNLVAKAGYFAGGTQNTKKDYILTAANKTVEPGVWYRLTVKSYADVGGAVAVQSNVKFPAFSISIDEVPFASNENTYDTTTAMAFFVGSPEFTALSNKMLVLSMSNIAGLNSVGFAGEGKVDDLVVTTFNPEANVVDFTFTLVDNDAGINGAVTYTCNAGSGEISGPTTIYCYENDVVTITYECKDGFTATWSGVANNEFTVVKDQADVTLTITKNAPSTIDFTFAKGEGVDAVTYTINDNEPTAKVKAGDVIKITDVDYADLYVAGLVREGYTKTISADEVAAGTAISVTVDAKALTGSGDGKVPEGTKAEDIGITNTAFENADNDQLNSLVKWATSTGKGSLELVNSMTFDNDGNPAGNGKTAAEAYLLDCAANQNAIDEAMEDFVLTVFSIGADGAMTFGVGEDAKGNGAAYANGKIEVRGKAALNAANWVKDCPGAAFFKAFLVK